MGYPAGMPVVPFSSVLDDPAGLPGYRRRIRVQAAPGFAMAMLEDDYHCMSVGLEHDGHVVTAVIPAMYREPWTTCPGAIAQLRETFTGAPLSDVTARRDKPRNCTHLHDLAVLAAGHAGQAGRLDYDIRVSDPVDGRRILDLRRDGRPLLRWIEQDGVLATPKGAAGCNLMALRDWIAGLDPAAREPARLLQWAAIVAHGRTLPSSAMDDARRMPPNCFTFQPERAAVTRRIGRIVDFSAGGRQPLDGIGGELIARVES